MHTSAPCSHEVGHTKWSCLSSSVCACSCGAPAPFPNLRIYCVPIRGGGNPTIICTEEIFRRLTGETGYAVIDIKLSKDASDSDIRCVETVTYTLCGLLCGLASGLPIHKRFYESFVTAYFSEAWESPVLAVIVIVAFIIIAPAAAAYAPSRRIKNMSVIEVIANG